LSKLESMIATLAKGRDASISGARQWRPTAQCTRRAQERRALV